MLIFILLFIAAPLIEIYFFIVIGGAIGALSTILLCIVTAFVGLSVIRYQGFRVLREIAMQVNRGRPPAMAIWHSLLLAVAGICLLVPGFVTDSMGALLLFPSFRAWLLSFFIRRYLQRKYSKQVNIIEGEFRIIR